MDATSGLRIRRAVRALLLTPDRHVLLVRFEFPDEPAGDRWYWMLIEDGEAELCRTDPGGDVVLDVRAASEPFVDWHRGAREWRSLVGAGEVTVRGPRALVRAFPHWNTGAKALA